MKNATDTKGEAFTNNPIYFSNFDTRVLDEALEMFLSAFDQYAAEHQLTDEQISFFRQLVLEVYTEKRAAYYLEQRLSTLNEYVGDALSSAFNYSFEKKSVTRLLYYKNKHQVITNEQY